MQHGSQAGGGFVTAALTDPTTACLLSPMVPTGARLRWLGSARSCPTTRCSLRWDRRDSSAMFAERVETSRSVFSPRTTRTQELLERPVLSHGTESGRREECSSCEGHGVDGMAHGERYRPQEGQRHQRGVFHGTAWPWRPALHPWPRYASPRGSASHCMAGRVPTCAGCLVVMRLGSLTRCAAAGSESRAVPSGSRSQVRGHRPEDQGVAQPVQRGPLPPTAKSEPAVSLPDRLSPAQERCVGQAQPGRGLEEPEGRTGHGGRDKVLQRCPQEKGGDLRQAECVRSVWLGGPLW